MKRPHMVRSYVTAMPYPIAVRAFWLVAVIVAVSACSVPAPGTSTAVGLTTAATAAGAATTTAVPATPVATAPATTAPANRAVALPNPALTPGAADPRVTQADIGQTICVSGYTTAVRPPESVTEAIKVQAMAAYGIHDSLSNYELDHLIPLEVGGAPADIRNLWPEPYETHGARRAVPGTGAETKDKVENAARQAVCAGQVPLAAAQQAIAADWYAFGRSLGVL